VASNYDVVKAFVDYDFSDGRNLRRCGPKKTPRGALSWDVESRSPDSNDRLAASLYSYSTRIAVKFQGREGKLDYYLSNSDWYSITTSSHQSTANSAIRQAVGEFPNFSFSALKGGLSPFDLRILAFTRYGRLFENDLSVPSRVLGVQPGILFRKRKRHLPLDNVKATLGIRKYGGRYTPLIILGKETHWLPFWVSDIDAAWEALCPSEWVEDLDNLIRYGDFWVKKATDSQLANIKKMSNERIKKWYSIAEDNHHGWPLRHTGGKVVAARAIRQDVRTFFVKGSLRDYAKGNLSLPEWHVIKPSRQYDPPWWKAFLRPM